MHYFFVIKEYLLYFIVLIFETVFRSLFTQLSVLTTTLSSCLQVLPTFDSGSIFLVLSDLLSDNLSSELTELSSPGVANESAGHGVVPVVCVGRYLKKLDQLNMLSRELWAHAALLECEDVRYWCAFVIVCFCLNSKENNYSE